MSVDLSQLMRFEVERPVDAGELLNGVQNPDGQFGAWGWITPTAGSFLRGGVSLVPTRHFRLIYTSPGSAASQFYTEPIPAAPGQYAAARWFAWAVTGLYKARIEWLDSTGAVLSATTPTSNLAQSGDARVYASYLAPASTAYCRLRFDHLNGSGGNPGAGTTMELHGVVLTLAATSGALGYVRTNLVPYPSAEATAVGWTADGGTIARSTAQAAVGTHSFALTKTGKKGGLGASLLLSGIQGGRDYAIQTKVRPDSTARVAGINITWINGTGEIAGKTVALYNEDSGAWSDAFGGVVTAPTDATILKVRVAFGAVPVGETHYFDAVMVEQAATIGTYFDGSTTDADGITYSWTGTAHASTSNAVGATGDVGTLVPVPYQNVLGPTAQISIDREDLNVGSLTARIFDAILDPTQTDLISPGRRVRVTTVDGDVVFAGKILTGNVKYHLLERVEQKRAEITLTAVDPIQPLAAAKRRETVATIAELPYVLEGAGVPWNVNGSGDQVASADVVSYNDNASALDQVAVTRDSVLGYAWVNRTGVLEVWDRAELDDTVAAELDESAYGSDIDIDWDLDRIINSVSVIVLRQIATTGATEEVTFGPYVDADSYRANGEHHADYTVGGFDVSDTAAIQAYAQQILDANATPTQRVNSLTLPVRNADELPNALVDLYDLVHVSNDRAGYDEDVRVTTVTHDITPSKWTVTLGFSADGAVAQSTAVPSPPPGVGEVKNEIDGSIDTLNADLAELNDVTLPALNADLAAAAADLAANAAAIASLNGLFPITATSISSGAITTPKMSANSINGDRIAANTLDAAKIVAGSITTDRMTANSINGDRIAANTIAASKIVANSITASQIAAGAITATTLAAGAISGQTVDASQISGNTLVVDAVNADYLSANVNLLASSDVVAGADFRYGIGHLPTTSTGGEILYVGSSGRIYPHNTPSDSAYKRDVATVPVDLDALADVEVGPITWRYREDVPFDVDNFNEVFFGVRADVIESRGGLDFLVQRDADGVLTFKEQRLPLALLAGYINDHPRIAELEAQATAQNAQIDALTARLDAMEA